MEGNLRIIFLCIVLVATVRSASTSAPLAVSLLKRDIRNINEKPAITRHLSPNESDKEDISERFYKKLFKTYVSHWANMNPDRTENLIEERGMFTAPNCPVGTFKYFGYCCPVDEMNRARCDLVEPKLIETL